MEKEVQSVPSCGFVVVFDCESDCSFARCPGVTKEDKILRYMQFTVCCAATIPTEAILSNNTSEEIMGLCTRYHWWRDEAVKGIGPTTLAFPVLSLPPAAISATTYDHRIHQEERPSMVYWISSTLPTP